jgi:hypothetical protein
MLAEPRWVLAFLALRAALEAVFVYLHTFYYVEGGDAKMMSLESSGVSYA